MNYAEALEYITGVGRFGVKLGTERVAALLDELGHPERGLRGALVAGTNGKGSTCAMAESILRAAGLRTGLMPKPHLVSYTERIQVDAEPISEADFAAELTRLQPVVDAVARTRGQPTEFELLTALAVQYLAPRVNRLVCEVGMGGRLDATNVLDLGVAVVTNVDLDHQRHLGNTVEQIAREKAAIIKPGNLAITGCQGVALAVVEEAARRQRATLWRIGHEIEMRCTDLGWAGLLLDVEGPGFSYRALRVPLLGAFQGANAALAVAAAHATGDFDSEAVVKGLERTRWPGRLEVVAHGPRVILDGGHNVAGLLAVGETLLPLLDGERLVVVFGLMADKDVDGMLRELAKLRPAHVFFTAVDNERAAEPGSVAAKWDGPHDVSSSPADAVAAARAAATIDGNVLVCGSLYLVGALRPVLVSVPA